MKKRVISLIIVITLAISCLTLFSAADISIGTETAGVITAELQTAMNAATATEKIPVSIWTTEIDTDIVEEVVWAKVGINRDMIRDMVDEGRIAEITQEQVDSYIGAERRIYAQMQTQAHQTFVEDYAFLKTASTAENSYLCSYAPMIYVELTKSQIQTLSLDSEVNTMYYAPDVEAAAEMETSLPTVKADYVRDEAFSGEGISIGILEYEGVPDKDNDTIGTNIKETFPANQTPSTHATLVAQILVSNHTTYTGIVPDAELYCASYTDNDWSSFHAGVEWLLRKNVHVINMSGRVDAITGRYSHYERWVDHIAHNHSVHFVKSAGNTANLVTHPGLAYNIITVGAINDKNTSETSDDEIASFSSYNEVSNNDGTSPPNKPDVVAPGENITTPLTTTSGTSLSAPHVTGIVTQLIQQYPALATLQDLMKAILTAAVSHDVHNYTSYQTTAFEKYGAGVVDAKACTEISSRGTFASSSFASTSTTPKTFTFTATQSDNEISVSLAWLKSVWFASGTSHEDTSTPETIAPLANLDLTIIDPDGNELPMCQYENYDANTNLVVIKFDPAVYGYGTYTVKVTIHESTGKRTYFGVAWWADRE